jgi:hypothetical protein
LQLRGQAAARDAVAAGAPANSSAVEAMAQVTAAPSAHRAEIVALVLRVEKVDCACENARRFANRTFLVADAPKLPLKDCGRVDCHCRYERIANRRSGKAERRLNVSRREEIRFEMKDDRRTGKDRRQTNNVWKQPV